MVPPSGRLLKLLRMYVTGDIEASRTCVVVPALAWLRARLAAMRFVTVVT